MASYKHGSNYERKGKVTYNAGIVKGIVALAVGDVQGVSLKNGNKKESFDQVKITFDGDNVSIDVSIEVCYGFNVPDVAFNTQQSIKQNIESMSKYKVGSIDVHVAGVVFPEESI